MTSYVPSYVRSSLGILLFFICLLQHSHALTPEQQQRYTKLTQQLKCVQCLANNLADSDAVIAENMKTFIKKQLQAGKTNDEIIAFLTKRYGEQIYLRPKFTGKTLWLWALPPLFLIVGFWCVFRQFNCKKDKQN